MATYKVPQDVEAEDKLLGPFTFRQFVYLMIVFGSIVLAMGLFQIFPLLAIIPVPFGLFFVILALPLKKEQPMETYLAAIITYHLKPKKRFWMPGQSESTILITAPKKVETTRTRNITEEEASHRLSFLANIVDTEGHAIKTASSSMRDEFYAEAYNTTDMFDKSGTTNLSHLITQEQQERHEEIVNQMRAAIQNSAFNYDKPATPSTSSPLPNERVINPTSNLSPSIVQPTIPTPPSPQPSTTPSFSPTTQAQLTNLANNNEYSIETIQQQADRIQNQAQQPEVYVSLH